MKIQEIYTLITTDKIQDCRDFYLKHFGFEVAFESPIFTQITAKSESGAGYSLAFMPTNHPFITPGQEPFSGKGAYIEIAVADARAFRDKLRKNGAPIFFDLKDEDWGQRRFMTKDPAGTLVDVVEAIEPKKGYYERFTAKKKEIK